MQAHAQIFLAAVSLMEVHFFTEYHGSTEQDYGNIAKGCEEESTIKNDTHQRRGHNVHTVVSFNAETDFSGKKKSSCQETQTESGPDCK